MTTDETVLTASFAAGCFWGVQERFDALPGVIDSQVGYSGGTKPNPTYEHVCGGNTGHAETVQVTYNPSVISYEQLLQVFWDNHDPTTKDRQGPDIGNQYRSVIFYHSLKQQQEAQQSKDELEQSGKYADPIVTQIIAALPFYPAEDYHQHYYRQRR